MRGVSQTGGLTKANRQLLLAAELTFDESRAERLADLAHRIGGLAGETDGMRDRLDSIEAELRRLAEDAHPEVSDAIGRALELLSAHRQTSAPA
jgi:uncharacterized membrane protein